VQKYNDLEKCSVSNANANNTAQMEKMVTILCMTLCFMTVICSLAYLVAEFVQDLPLGYFLFAHLVWQFNHGLFGFVIINLRTQNGNYF
jgi:hypothetical protein